MPYSGTTYSELSTAADEVEDLIANNQRRLVGARSQFSDIVSSLTAVASEYGPIVQAADTLAAQYPNDPAVTVLRAHIQRLLADFNAIQQEAQTRDQQVNS